MREGLLLIVTYATMIFVLLSTPVRVGETGMYQIYIPLVDGPDGAVARGSGLAHSPKSHWALAATGTHWSFSWQPRCKGKPWCVPLFAVRHQEEYDLEEVIWSCGARCNALLLLNEPMWDSRERCGPDCQVQFYMRWVTLAHELAPDLQIIIGNWVQYAWLDWDIITQLEEEWREQYPGSEFCDFVRRHKLYFGVHLYADESYDKAVWRDQILSVRRRARECGAVDIVLSEWGCLSSGKIWKQVVRDQLPWLERKGVANAIYKWEADASGMCCQMGNEKDPPEGLDFVLTDYADFYNRIRPTPP